MAPLTMALLTVGQVPPSSKGLSAVGVGPFVFVLISPSEVAAHDGCPHALYVLDPERSLRVEQLEATFTPR